MVVSHAACGDAATTATPATGHTSTATPILPSSPVRLSVHRLSARCLLIKAGLYALTVNVDGHVDVSQMDVDSWDELTGTLQPDGLLGRTWDAQLDVSQSDEEAEQFREMATSCWAARTRTTSSARRSLCAGRGAGVEVPVAGSRGNSKGSAGWVENRGCCVCIYGFVSCGARWWAPYRPFAGFDGSGAALDGSLRPPSPPC